MFQAHVAENIFDPIPMDAEPRSKAQSGFLGFNAAASAIPSESGDFSPGSMSSSFAPGMMSVPTAMFSPFPQGPVCVRDFSPMRLSSSTQTGVGEQDPRLPFYSGCTSSKMTSYPTTRSSAALKMKLQDAGSHGKGGLAASLGSAFSEVPKNKGLFSKKVFVGGLPPDIDEEEISRSFWRFGPLQVDWPTKGQTRHIFPPKGYVFLIFQYAKSVEELVGKCYTEGDDYFYILSSASQQNKIVQVRPWKLSDGECHYDTTKEVNSRLTAFVGGVPRPLRADQLAKIMSDHFGNVCYTVISVDDDMDYPRGAGRVTFSTQDSYINAIQTRYVEVTLGELQKKVELKPYEDTVYERQRPRDQRPTHRRLHAHY